MDLIKKIERLAKSCETLEFENNVFEQYYQREVGTTAISQGRETARKISDQARSSRFNDSGESERVSKVKHQVKNQLIKPPTEEELNQVIQKLKDLEAGYQMSDICEVVNSLIERKRDADKRNEQKYGEDKIEGSKNIGERSNGANKPLSSTVINFNVSPRTLNRLSNENKGDLVMAEIDEIEHEISWQKECIQKTINSAKAMIEFLDQKFKDHLKSQAEFEREARNSIHYSSKNYQAEKIERFFEEKKRMKEALAKKIMLKTGTLGTQIRKLNVQIQQKEEMGGVLHKVDLEQLQFENQQYQEKIDAKNRQLLEAKKKQTTIIQLLNNKKLAMTRLQADADVCQEELNNRNENQIRLDKEISQVRVELRDAKNDLDDLSEVLKTYKVPSTMNYIKTKSELDDLRHKCKTWTRKVDITTIRRQDLNRKWVKLCNTQNRMAGKM